MDSIKGLQEAIHRLGPIKPPSNDRPEPIKLSKASVLYLHRIGTHYQCKDCPMFLASTERCWIHDSSAVIKSYGTCGFFVKGRKPSGLDLEPMGWVSKLESGYEEHPEGTSCARCEYFSAEKADCKKVDRDSPGDDSHKIDPGACCNNFEAEES